MAHDQRKGEKVKFDFKEFEEFIKAMAGIWLGCTVLLAIGMLIGNPTATGPIGDTFGDYR